MHPQEAVVHAASAELGLRIKSKGDNLCFAVERHRCVRLGERRMIYAIGLDAMPARLALESRASSASGIRR
jgi:hypothetical protein